METLMVQRSAACVARSSPLSGASAVYRDGQSVPASSCKGIEGRQCFFAEDEGMRAQGCKRAVHHLKSSFVVGAEFYRTPRRRSFAALATLRPVKAYAEWTPGTPAKREDEFSLGGGKGSHTKGGVARPRVRVEWHKAMSQGSGLDGQSEEPRTRLAGGANAVAKHMGKVGVYERMGNVSLASFSSGLLPQRQRRKVDIAKMLSQMLPYVVVATAVLALLQPGTFSWFSKKYYAPALGGIMLSIGIQLSVADFILVFRRPLPVLVGFAAQYALKPLLGLAVAAAFAVPPKFFAGLVLTASVAGAQLSSYATYLGEGDVAFSIVLTSLTTISSVAMTPLLTHLLIGAVVPVDAVAMAKSILQVVICPVLGGLALNTYARPLVDRVRPIMPLMALACTSLCIGSPLALNRQLLVSMDGLRLLLPVLTFHILAFTCGYWLTRVGPWRQDERMSRTISLCTGMQSSTLAMLLACQFLGATHCLPPACSVVVMALMGLSLGAFWGKGGRVADCLRPDWGLRLQPSCGEGAGV